jgi:iron(III) transport system substrate-binding protein
VVQISPWLIGFNTDKVKGADVPRDWPDVVNAKWKGQIILPDPRATDAYLDFWLLLLDTHGEQFFTQLRALNPRQINSGVPAMATVAAGENTLTFPAVASVVAELKSKGASLGSVIPELTTGIEFHVALTARGKAKHPNAARLFANYVMTQEGNAVMARDSGAVSVFDTSALPKRYQFAKPGAAARKDQLYKLLGF